MHVARVLSDVKPIGIAKQTYAQIQYIRMGPVVFHVWFPGIMKQVNHRCWCKIDTPMDHIGVVSDIDICFLNYRCKQSIDQSSIFVSIGHPGWHKYKYIYKIYNIHKCYAYMYTYNLINLSFLWTDISY